MSNADSKPSGDRIDVITLDVLPNGLPSDNRPRSQATPIAYGLDTDAFRLYELTLTDEAHVLAGYTSTPSPGADYPFDVTASQRL